MIPAAFDYTAPTTLQEALGVLAEAGDDAKVLAGGQSLLPILRMRLNAPEKVVDLGRIDELRGISDEGDHIVIGAMTTYADVLASDAVRQHAALLAKAVKEVADPQIRHRGTVGGALVHADPAMTNSASRASAGPGGERIVAAGDFFRDLFETAVGDGELLARIRVPKHTGWGAHYEKFVRVAHQWSIVAVGATVRVDAGSIAEARIGLTNMGATPLRATAVEQALVGRRATDEAVREACAAAAEGTNPPSDLNGSAEYRRHLATVLTRRAVLAAAGV